MHSLIKSYWLGHIQRHHELLVIQVARGLQIVQIILLLGVSDYYFHQQILLRAEIWYLLSLMTALEFSSLIRMFLVHRLAHGRELFVQLALDMLLMTLLLSQTGGSTNPFIFWLIVPVCLAAWMLDVRYVLVLWAGSLSAYGFLLLHYRPMIPFDMMHHGDEVMLTSTYTWHIRGMALDFVFSLTLITALSVWMRRSNQRRDNMLTEQREQILRDEHLLGFATMAASTAHSLATPMNTLALLLEDLMEEGMTGPRMDTYRLMLQQLNLGRNLLTQLRHRAQESQEPWSRPLEEVMDDLLLGVQILHPGIDWLIKNSIEVSIGLPMGLIPVIQNLLHNAAKVARTKVLVRFYSDQNGDWVMIVEDDGCGIDQPLLKNLGLQAVANGSGMGMGWLLAERTLKKWQGTLTVLDTSPVGSKIKISIPWNCMHEFSYC